MRAQLEKTLANLTITKAGQTVNGIEKARYLAQLVIKMHGDEIQYTTLDRAKPITSIIRTPKRLEFDNNGW